MGKLFRNFLSSLRLLVSLVTYWELAFKQTVITTTVNFHELPLDNRQNSYNYFFYLL